MGYHIALMYERPKEKLEQHVTRVEIEHTYGIMVAHRHQFTRNIMSTSDLPYEVHEQLPITLFESVVLAVRVNDGQIYLSLRDLCAVLHIDLSSQRRRIVANQRLRPNLIRLRVRTAGGRQEQDFMLLDTLSIWLLSVQERRVGTAAAERLAYVQSYLEDAVRAAFAALTGLPEGSSRQIEDLHELERIDRAFTTLAERQGALEQSQDRARTAWRDLAIQVRALTDRLQHLERQVGTKLSDTQRGVIYHMVQTWGAAKAARERDHPSAAAYRAVWAVVKARFKVAHYEDIPAAKYEECLTFIRSSYRALTGEELPAMEQGTLGFDEEQP